MNCDYLGLSLTNMDLDKEIHTIELWTRVVLLGPPHQSSGELRKGIIVNEGNENSAKKHPKFYDHNFM